MVRALISNNCKTVAVLCAATLATLGLSGCAEDGKTAHSKVTKTPQAAADFVIQLDGYNVTPSEGRQIAKARHLLIRDCMKRFDLNLRLPAYPPVGSSSNAWSFGWLEQFQVTRYGYQGPPGLLDGLYSAITDGGVELTVPPEMVPVFYGETPTFRDREVPKGGCAGEAESQLKSGAPEVTIADGGNPVISERGVAFYRGEVHDQARADDRYVKVVRAWSLCMKKAGYDYKALEEAESDEKWGRSDSAENGVESQQVTEQERRTATADDGCRKEVNYSGVYYSLYLEYESELVESKGQALNLIKKLQQVRLRNAVRALETAGS